MTQLPQLSDRGGYRERIIPATDLPQFPEPPYTDAYPCLLPDGDYLELPMLPLPPDDRTAIAFLCSNQTSFEVEDRLSTYMADLVRHLNPEIVVGMPTLGMVYAASVAKKLGHDRYIPLGYSRKFWYDEALSVPVRSITSPTIPKTVYIDPKLLERIAGKRVLLVEDVISTGGTVFAELKLMQKLKANVVGVVTAVKETNVWVKKLASLDASYPDLVYAPIHCPLFEQQTNGWVPVPNTLAPPNRLQ
jgi:adenine/guanine phosphoribosyltransferase-like PRPP-binding protein